MNKFLNFQGLAVLLRELIERFATEEEVSQVENDTENYVLNVDYSQLQFDTTEIIKN